MDKKCKLVILKIYNKTILLYEAEIWTTKREYCKIQAMEMNFLKDNLKENQEGHDNKYYHKIGTRGR